jgi:response regulator of citrate/malate metabolism
VITTLVVDDDYHVAHAHALSVAKVPGFVVVGEAHTGAEALALVAQHGPDLLLLDLYLPDMTGLDVVRRLSAGAGSDSDESPMPPDFLMITAARDVSTIQAAVSLGALHYLVKPFTVAALREQLLAYAQFREQLGRVDVADQRAVDELLRLRGAQPLRPQRALPTTTARVLEVVSSSAEAVTAAEVAARLAMSRPTAQRHLATLVRRGVVELDLAYGRAGRPEHLYRPRRG